MLLLLPLSTGGAGYRTRAESRRPVCEVRAQAHALSVVKPLSLRKRVCVQAGECARGWGRASSLTRA